MSRQVYTAESTVRHPAQVLRDMIHGLLSSRYVAYRLARKDIKTAYATEAFGMIWDLLDPLVLSAIFYFLMRGGVINGGDMGMPRAIFVVYGMMLYLTFCESITQSMTIMNRSQNLLNHLKLPPEALILSVIYRMSFNALFRIVVMLIFSLVTAGTALYSAFQGAEGDAVSILAVIDESQAFSLLGFLQFLLFFPTIILAGVAIGTFLAPFNVIYHDVGRFIRVVLVPLRFTSPVIYAIPPASFLGKLQVVNPLTPILENLRMLATNNSFVDLPILGLHLVVFTVIGLVGWFIFHISVPVLAERT
jgi:ABC-type polysaccharide/polyol phosphate export permease